MELPIRKKMRLKDYNYSECGIYFITICVKERKKMLSNIIHNGVLETPDLILSNFGKTVEKQIKILGKKYDGIFIEKYVIMPNHIHLLIRLTKPDNADFNVKDHSNAVIPKYIASFKRHCTNEIGHSIFQRSFYDHIVRNEADYLRIANYIETNPHKWNEDEYYILD